MLSNLIQYTLLRMIYHDEQLNCVCIAVCALYVLFNIDIISYIRTYMRTDFVKSIQYTSLQRPLYWEFNFNPSMDNWSHAKSSVGCTVAVWEWINNCIRHFLSNVFSYLCRNQIYFRILCVRVTKLITVLTVMMEAVGRKCVSTDGCVVSGDVNIVLWNV